MNVNVEERNKKICENMKKIKNKIVVMSGKGGVGKSTVSVNLAYGLAMRGYKVGILDADLHGPNIPIMLGKEGVKLKKLSEPLKIMENLFVASLSFYIPDDSPIIWRGIKKMGAILEMLEQINWGELDYLVVDLPPGTGDETLTIAQNIGTDASSIIVTTPQNVSVLDSKKSVKFSKLINLKILGIIENMSGFICPDCNKELHIFKRGGGEKMALETNTRYLGNIPMEKTIVDSGDEGIPYITTSSIGSEYMNKIIDRILK